MRTIQRGSQPQALIQWKADNRTSPQNLTYSGGSFPHKEVLQALVKQQGGLCAYTMLRISTATAHIEHLKPQTLCRREDAALLEQSLPPLREDVEWQNLVACTPAPNTPKLPYGAHEKRDWWDADLFVSPYQANCEVHFHFSKNGTVSPAAGNSAAVKTINILKLNDASLKEKREIAIKARGLHDLAEKPLSINAVKRQIEQWNTQLGSDTTGEELPEFIVALLHAAQEYYKKLVKRASRKKYTQNQR